jgi:hypothetical protein
LRTRPVSRAGSRLGPARRPLHTTLGRRRCLGPCLHWRPCCRHRLVRGTRIRLPLPLPQSGSSAAPRAASPIPPASGHPIWTTFWPRLRGFLARRLLDPRFVARPLSRHVRGSRAPARSSLHRQLRGRQVGWERAYRRRHLNHRGSRHGRNEEEREGRFGAADAAAAAEGQVPPAVA